MVGVLHGRAIECGRIESLVAGAGRAEDGVLVLRGEQGAGATALLDHAAATAGSVPVLRGACHAGESGVALAALSHLLAPLGRVERGDRVATTLAARDLLTTAARAEGLVVLLDDAHWIDRASADTLVSLLRRPAGHGLVVIIAERAGRVSRLAALPGCDLTPLDAGACAAILAEHHPDMIRRVRERLIAFAGGNPGTLTTCAHALTREHRLGHAASPWAYLERFRSPAQAGLAAPGAVLAALPEPTVALLALVAVENTRELRSITPAANLLGVSLGDLAPAERAGVVGVLDGRIVVRQPLVPAIAYGTASFSLRAAVHRALAAAGHPDGPWHRAVVAIGPDEGLAAELEELAAQTVDAAQRTDALCASADLTPDPAARAARLAAAARLARDAGQTERAKVLAAGCEDHPGHGGIGAEVAGGPGDRAGAEASGATAAALASSWRNLAEGDDTEARLTAAGLLARLRSRHEYGLLPQALEVAAGTLVQSGTWDGAEKALEEGLDMARETGQEHQAARIRARLAWLAAARGEEEGCRALAAEAIAYGEARAAPEVVALGLRALGLLDLGRGRYGEAARTLELVGGAGPDLAEAAVRSGRLDLAAWTLSRMETSGPAARAVRARCEGLLARGKAADEAYARALRAHDRLGRPYDLARTALVYGEWLRRMARRAEARARLTTALEIFQRLGAVPWALRAAEERDATGGARRDPIAGLTAQESRVARLAARGVANREIAQRLNLSPRTVESHLYRAFQKLGVSSRGELARRLPELYSG